MKGAVQSNIVNCNNNNNNNNNNKCKWQIVIINAKLRSVIMFFR